MAEPTSSVALPVLGLPVRFESNRPEVLALAANAFPRGARPVPGDAPVRITILVEPDDRRSAQVAALVHRIVGRRTLYGPGPLTAICDPDRREAIAHVAPSLLDEPDRLRREVVEALTLSVVTHLDRQPLHGAAVVEGGAALLLCAPSGTGKSTLAYAASRSGLQVLADDAVYVQCKPTVAIWGRPRALHLPADAPAFFPELAMLEPRRLPNGKVKLVVPLLPPEPHAATLEPRSPQADPESDFPAPSAARPPLRLSAGICLLDREGPPGLRALAPADAERTMRRALEPGFDVFAATIGEPIRRLAAAGCWRLTLPEHPADAISLLLEAMKAASPARR